MHNYQGHPGVAFVAAKTFQSEYGVHEAGSLVPEATQFPNLDVLVANRWLYAFSPKEGYEHLPSHLFAGTNLLEEIEAIIAGDPSADRGVEQFPDGKPDFVEEAERQADAQQLAYDQMMADAAEKKAKAIDRAQEGDTRTPPNQARKTAAAKVATTHTPQKKEARS